MSKKKEIKKHSSAIRATGKMSLLERKVSNILWANAQDTLLTETVHEIYLPLLSEIAGYNSNDTSKLKKAFSNLRHISIEWDFFNEDGENEWGDVPWLIPTIKGNRFLYQYPEALKRVLANPEIYGVVNLQMQRQFVSGYALAIYEICSQFKGLVKKNGTAYTEWFSLEEFKKMLGVQNNTSYEQFKELNRTVLKPSIHEINGTLKKYAGTDIFIAPEYKKMNRSISDIRFKIKLNPQTELPLEKNENDELRKLPLYQKLRDRGLTDKGAIHVIQAYEPEYLEEKIAIVDQAEERGQIKSSTGGYLKRAIDEDYKPSKKKSEAREQAEKQKLEDEAKARKEQQQTEQLSLLKRDISRELREEYIATLSDQEQSDLLAELKANLPSVLKSSIKDLSHSGLSNEVNNLVPDFDKKLAERLESAS